MSVEITVIFKRERLPTPETWQRALTEAGFAVALDTDFDPVEFTGFLPATYEERSGGFEYFYEELDRAELTPEELARIGDRDAVVSFVTHSDFTELMTSGLAAAVFTHIVDGVLHDTSADEYYDASAALTWGREMEAAILPELSPP